MASVISWVLGIAAALAVVVGAIAFVVLPGSEVPAPTTPSPAPTTPTPAPTGTPTGRFDGPTTPTTRTPPATRFPTATVTATPAPVRFDLVVRQTQPPKTSGFLNPSVRVWLAARLTNLGDVDAHDVTVNVRARVGDERVRIDGRSAYEIDVGLLEARATARRDVSFTINMSLAQGMRAQDRGITFDIEVESTERTQALPPVHCTSSGCG
ncbi:MAG: hypothetical protein FJ318_09170 [SAR202 cluster bacterium]|nr:hypothetical protein [SAR202 cluster bacterium]